MQQLNKGTQYHQSSLAAYCRTGVYQEIPGVKTTHVIQYRRLVYNVVDDMLQSAYPLTKELLSGEEWNELVQEFFSGYACQSPQVWYMPKELYEYITQQEHHPLTSKYPFLPDLLKLEWLEIALFMMEDRPAICDPKGERLVLNPEHELVHLQYPVHLKEAKQITGTDKGDYFLVMFREPDTGEVQFMQLSPGLARVIELLDNNPVSIATLSTEICAELQMAVTQDVQDMMRLFVDQGLQNKLIAGFLSDN